MNFSPEIFSQIEVLLGSVGVTIGFFFGIFLLLVKNKYTKANIFLAIYLLVFSIRMGKSLFHNYYAINASFLVISLSLLLAVGPSLWLYSKHLKQSDYTPKKTIYILHYLPFFGIICFSWMIPVNNESGAWVFHLGLFLHGISYCMLTLYTVLSNKNLKISDEELKIDKWLILLTLVTFLMFVNYILIFFSVVPYYPSGAFLFSVLIIFVSIWAMKNPFLFKKRNEKYFNSPLSDKKVNAYYNKLCDLMDSEKMYLNPQLSLNSLSKTIGITSKQLSQVINQSQNQNYSQYIAGYRVEEAKRLLADKKYKDYKISAIAYESGFNTISSFNVAFKKMTHITAIQFRQSLAL